MREEKENRIGRTEEERIRKVESKKKKLERIMERRKEGKEKVE